MNFTYIPSFEAYTICPNLERESIFSLRVIPSPTFNFIPMIVLPLSISHASWFNGWIYHHGRYSLSGLFFFCLNFVRLPRRQEPKNFLLFKHCLVVEKIVWNKNETFIFFYLGDIYAFLFWLNSCLLPRKWRNENRMNIF